MLPGTRVKVRIWDLDFWSEAAVRAMEGLTGVIEQVVENHNGTGKPAYLVRFDAPVKRWWPAKNPPLVEVFHFSPEDLLSLGVSLEFQGTP